MDSKKRRRRKKEPEPISFTTMLILFLLLLLIPLAFWWYGSRHVERTVPQYATGHLTEISGSSAAEESQLSPELPAE